jgi:hypothetical protein
MRLEKGQQPRAIDLPAGVRQHLAVQTQVRTWLCRDRLKDEEYQPTGSVHGVSRSGEDEMNLWKDSPQRKAKNFNHEIHEIHEKKTKAKKAGSMNGERIRFAFHDSVPLSLSLSFLSLSFFVDFVVETSLSSAVLNSAGW